MWEHCGEEFVKHVAYFCTSGHLDDQTLSDITERLFRLQNLGDVDTLARTSEELFIFFRLPEHSCAVRFGLSLSGMPGTQLLIFKLNLF